MLVAEMLQVFLGDLATSDQGVKAQSLTSKVKWSGTLPLTQMLLCVISEADSSWGWFSAQQGPCTEYWDLGSGPLW